MHQVTSLFDKIEVLEAFPKMKFKTHKRRVDFTAGNLTTEFDINGKVQSLEFTDISDLIFTKEEKKN